VLVEGEQVPPSIINSLPEKGIINKQVQQCFSQLIDIIHFIKTVLQVLVS
jgi:hypothetical protein